MNKVKCPVAVALRVFAVICIVVCFIVAVGIGGPINEPKYLLLLLASVINAIFLYWMANVAQHLADIRASLTSKPKVEENA